MVASAPIVAAKPHRVQLHPSNRPFYAKAPDHPWTTVAGAARPRNTADEDGLGVRTTGREKGVVHRYDALGDYAQLAAEGRFTIPIARTFTWDDWQDAVEISMAGRAHGKLVLVMDDDFGSKALEHHLAERTFTGSLFALACLSPASAAV